MGFRRFLLGGSEIALEWKQVPGTGPERGFKVNTRKTDAPKVQPPQKRPKRPEMQAPRPWEPVPLQIPVPEPPPTANRDEASESKTPRGVVIIQYGDE